MANRIITMSKPLYGVLGQEYDDNFVLNTSVSRFSGSTAQPIMSECDYTTYRYDVEESNIHNTTELDKNNNILITQDSYNATRYGYKYNEYEAKKEYHTSLELLPIYTYTTSGNSVTLKINSSESFTGTFENNIAVFSEVSSANESDYYTETKKIESFKYTAYTNTYELTDTLFGSPAYILDDEKAIVVNDSISRSTSDSGTMDNYDNVTYSYNLTNFVKYFAPSQFGTRVISVTKNSLGDDAVYELYRNFSFKITEYHSAIEKISYIANQSSDLLRDELGYISISKNDIYISTLGKGYINDERTLMSFDQKYEEVYPSDQNVFETTKSYRINNSYSDYQYSDYCMNVSTYATYNVLDGQKTLSQSTADGVRFNSDGIQVLGGPFHHEYTGTYATFSNGNEIWATANGTYTNTVHEIESTVNGTFGYVKYSNDTNTSSSYNKTTFTECKSTELISQSERIDYVSTKTQFLTSNIYSYENTIRGVIHDDIYKTNVSRIINDNYSYYNQSLTYGTASSSSTSVIVSAYSTPSTKETYDVVDVIRTEVTRTFERIETGYSTTTSTYEFKGLVDVNYLSKQFKNFEDYIVSKYSL